MYKTIDRLSCTHLLPSWRNLFPPGALLACALPPNVTSDFLFRTFDSVQNPTRKREVCWAQIGQALTWIFWSITTTLPMGWLLSYTHTIHVWYGILHHVFFVMLIQWTVHSWNQKLLSKCSENLGSTNSGGKDVQVQYGPNSTAQFPRPARVFGFFGGAAFRHMLGVSSGVQGFGESGIWVVEGRQSGPSK